MQAMKKLGFDQYYEMVKWYYSRLLEAKKRESGDQSKGGKEVGELGEP